jgi:hypothetical protein
MMTSSFDQDMIVRRTFYDVFDDMSAEEQPNVRARAFTDSEILCHDNDVDEAGKTCSDAVELRGCSDDDTDLPSSGGSSSGHSTPPRRDSLGAPPGNLCSAPFHPMPQAGPVCQPINMQTGVPMQFLPEGTTMQPMMLISSDKGNMWVPAMAYFTAPDVGPMSVPQAPNHYVRPAENGRDNGTKGSRRHKPILPSPIKPLPEASGEPRTTVMLRNMPNNYSRDMLLELLDSEGFSGQYDFLYLPIDFQTKACLGYAFINLVSAAAAMRFWRTFDGYTKWAIPSRKQSGVSWSGHQQGLDAHVDRYRNSPVMSDAIPDEYKPVLFIDGVRVPFPPPTKKLKALRLKACHPLARDAP